MARMTSTFAPLEIRLSTSVSCLVGEPCASAEMYFAPCGLERLLDRRLVGLPALFLEVRPRDADSHVLRHRGERRQAHGGEQRRPQHQCFHNFHRFPPLEVRQGPTKSFLDRSLIRRSGGASTLILDRAPAQLVKSRMRRLSFKANCPSSRYRCGSFPARRESVRRAPETEGRALRTSPRGRDPGRRLRPSRREAGTCA